MTPLFWDSNPGYQISSSMSSKSEVLTTALNNESVSANPIFAIQTSQSRLYTI